MIKFIITTIKHDSWTNDSELVMLKSSWKTTKRYHEAKKFNTYDAAYKYLEKNIALDEQSYSINPVLNGIIFKEGTRVCEILDNIIEFNHTGE